MYIQIKEISFFVNEARANYVCKFIEYFIYNRTFVNIHVFITF